MHPSSKVEIRLRFRSQDKLRGVSLTGIGYQLSAIGYQLLRSQAEDNKNSYRHLVALKL
jgi:hypothetical protein